jgi:hypothetical protein
MGSVVLPHLRTGWHVDQAIMNEDERLVVIRFGRDYSEDCMRQDEVLFKIADRVKNFAVVYGQSLQPSCRINYDLLTFLQFATWVSVSSSACRYNLTQVFFLEEVPDFKQMYGG